MPNTGSVPSDLLHRRHEAEWHEVKRKVLFFLELALLLGAR